MKRRQWKRIVGPGAVLGVGIAGALLPQLAGGEQLMSVTYTTPPTGEENVVQTLGSVGPATEPVGVSLRISAALPTREGTDVLFIGKDPALTPVYVRAGRQGRKASGDWGDFKVVASGNLVLSQSGSVTLPAAAWLDASERVVVVADGTSTLRLYDALLGMAPYAPYPGGPSFGGPSVPLPGGAERVVVAPGGTAIYAASSGSGVIYRATSAGAMDQCAIPFAPGGITDLAISPNGDFLVAGVRDGSGNGSLAVVPAWVGASCPTTAAVQFGATGQAQLRSVAIEGSGATWQVFTLRDNGEAQQWSQAGGVLTAGTTAITTMQGALAVRTGAAQILASGAGPLPLVAASETDTPGPLAYQPLTYAGALSAGTRVDVASRVVLRGADPQFSVTGSCTGCAVTHRTVDLSGTYTGTSARVSFLPIEGGAGRTLRLQRGTCAGTTVLEAYSVAGALQIGKTCNSAADCASGQCVTATPSKVCAPILSGTAQSAAFTAQPREAGSADALLAFAQVSRGENCQMALTSEPNGGGGALIRVQGSSLADRALALVLDRSGSMAGAIGGTSSLASQVRIDALNNAVDTLIDTLNALPDSQTARVVVLPYDQQSKDYRLPKGAGAFPENLFYSAGDLSTNRAAIHAALTPGGSTNIRGALRSAAEWLDTLRAGGSILEGTVLLMTDGMHNTVGNPLPENNTPTTYDPVTNLPSPSTVSFLKAPGAGGGAPRVSRLYAVGLSEAAVHESLKTLVHSFYGTSGGNPQGFLSYADSGNELQLFFNKVLWNHLDATSFLDPVVQITEDQPYTQALDIGKPGKPVIQNYSLMAAGAAGLSIDGRDQELVVAASWQDPQRVAQVGLTYKDLMGVDASAKCSFNLRRGVCYLPLASVQPGTKPVLTVAKSARGLPGPLDVVVEVAGRSPVQLRAAADRVAYVTGQRMNLRATLREHGLPLVGATVQGTLSVPMSGLGTALSNGKVAAADVAALVKKEPDLTPAAAKLRLLGAGALPARGSQTVQLFDDGLHGDGGANDGVYGAQVDAPVPGDYRLTVRATYNSRYFGAGAREAHTAVRVGVGLDGKASSIVVRAYQAPVGKGKDLRPGSLVVWLRPQDSRGNLVGPGSGDALVFRQQGRVLPASYDEPADQDGTYTVVVTGIGPDGPVSLTTKDGLFSVLPKPDQADGGLNLGGCGCRSAAVPAPVPVPAALLAVWLGLLAIRRRRARA